MHAAMTFSRVAPALGVVLGFTLLPGSSLAVTGLVLGSEARLGGPDAVCRLQIGDPAAPETCSGTLISPTEIATAAHCFGKHKLTAKNVRASCGYRAPDPAQDGANNQKGATFAEERLASSVRIESSYDLSKPAWDQSSDHAIVTIAEPSKLTPIPPVALDAESLAVVKKETCEVSGYGYGGATAAEFGVGLLRTAPIRDEMVFRSDGLIVVSYSLVLDQADVYAQFAPLAKSDKMQENLQLVMTLSAHGAVSSSPVWGDSGGSLICDKGGAKPGKVLLGITTGFRLGAIDTKQAIYLENRWRLPRLDKVTRQLPLH